MKIIKQLIAFIREVANDERIPESDKVKVLALLALIISPVDLIPDWIPIIGIMDDLVLLALVMDYFFVYIDQEILLSHYPWGMKSYVRVRRVARAISVIVPSWLKVRLWKFKPSVY